jgi:hypothetical protein
MTTGRINQVASQGLRVLGEVAKHGRSLAHAVASAARSRGITLASNAILEPPLLRDCCFPTHRVRLPWNELGSPKRKRQTLLSVESNAITHAVKGPKPLLSGARALFPRSARSQRRELHR